MKEVVITHCGKLGDMLYSLQIASWLFKRHEVKTWWVLPKCFHPFRHISNLLLAQPFTSAATIVDYPVLNYDCGGQPYRFDPRGMPYDDAEGERRFIPPLTYFNLGFRGYPNKYCAAYMAEEHRLGYDRDFRIELGPGIEKTEEILRSIEGPMARFAPHAEPMPPSEDLLVLARRMHAAKEVHTWFCGLAILCYLSDTKVTVHRVPGHASIPLYYEGDYERFITFVEHPERG